MTGVKIIENKQNKGSPRIERLFLILKKNILKKACLTDTNEITFHEKKSVAILHSTQKNKAIHKSQKYTLPPSFFNFFFMLIGMLTTYKDTLSRPKK